MNEPHAAGRLEGLSARVDALSGEIKRMETLWSSTVDDIKAIIRSEISDLKSEQIKDMRTRIDVLDARLDGQNVMLGNVRTKQDRWDTGAGVLNWIVRLIVGIGGAVAGYLGAKHIG